MTRKSSMALPPSSPAAAGTIVAPHLTQTQSQMVYYPLPSQTLARASPLRPVAPPQPQTPGKALQHQQQYLHGHGQSQQSQQIQVRGTNHHHQAGRPVPPPPPFQLVLSPPICSLPLPMTTNATTTMAETMSMVPSGSAHWQYHQHQQQEPLSSQLLLTMAAPPPPPPPPQLLSSQPQLAPIYASAATLEAIVHSAVTNAMRECAGMLHTRGGGPAAAPLLSAGSLLRDTIEQPYDSLGSITLSQPPYGGTGSSSGLGTQHHHFSLVASQPIVLSHTTPTPTPPPLPPPPGPPLPSSINEPLEADHRVLLAAVLALRAELATTNSPTPLLSPVQLPPGADEATRLADGTASPPDAAHAATVHLARSTVTAVRALVASRARDAARTEKARAERDAARVDRDAARGERDDACKDRDAVCSDHDKARGDLRAAITYIATKNTDFDAAAKNHAAEVLAAATRAAELEGQVANLRAQLAESYAALDLAAERATAAAQAQAASDLEAAVDEERARGSTVAADLRVERDAAVARTSELVAAHESEIAHIHGHLDVARIAERCAADREAVAAAQCSDRESQLQSAQDELANVCRDRNAAQAAEATARTEIERLEGLLKDAERDIHDAAETNAKMWGRVENEESARKELEVQLADEQVRTSTVQSELAGERARASTMESELAEERSRLSTLQSELSDEQARVSALKSEMADAWGRIFTLEKELTQERDWGSARESDLEETKGRLESATSKLVSAERRATEAEADAKSKAAAAADTSAVVEQLRAQVKDLEQQLVAAKQQRPPSTSKRAVFAPGGFDFGLPPPLPLPQMRSAVIDLTGNSADMSAFADGTHEHGSPVPAAAAVTAALVAQRYPPPVSVSSSAANSPNVDSPVPRKRRRVEIESPCFPLERAALQQHASSITLPPPPQIVVPDGTTPVSTAPTSIDMTQPTPPQHYVICLTGFTEHGGDFDWEARDRVMSAIAIVGGQVAASPEAIDVTHVICPPQCATLGYFSALVTSKWIIQDLAWIDAALAARSFPPETNYGGFRATPQPMVKWAVHFTPGFDAEMAAKGRSGLPRTLITLGGGRVVDTLQGANVVLVGSDEDAAQYTSFASERFEDPAAPAAAGGKAAGGHSRRRRWVWTWAKFIQRILTLKLTTGSVAE